MRYNEALIKSFGDKSTERLFEDQAVKKFEGVAARAKRKLEAIHAAIRLEDLKVPPSNHLEKLHGRLKAFHSILVNERWRAVFRWIGRDAYEVSIVDYH